MEDRRSRKRDKTRQALVASALELFAEKGIYEPSIEEITSRADLGKGTFYQYFPSREVLIAELVDGGFELLMAEVHGRVSDAQIGAVRIPLVLQAHDAFFAEHPHYLLLFHQARGWMKMARHHGESLSRAFADYIHQLGAVVGISSSEALVLAGFIAGTLSFKKILAVEAAGEGLTSDLALLANAAQTEVHPEGSCLPEGARHVR